MSFVDLRWAIPTLRDLGRTTADDRGVRDEQGWLRAEISRPFDRKSRKNGARKVIGAASPGSARYADLLATANRVWNCGVSGSLWTTLVWISLNFAFSSMDSSSVSLKPSHSSA